MRYNLQTCFVILIPPNLSSSFCLLGSKLPTAPARWLPFSQLTACIRSSRITIPSIRKCQVLPEAYSQISILLDTLDYCGDFRDVSEPSKGILNPKAEALRHSKAPEHKGKDCPWRVQTSCRVTPTTVRLRGFQRDLAQSLTAFFELFGAVICSELFIFEDDCIILTSAFAMVDCKHLDS